MPIFSESRRSALREATTHKVSSRKFSLRRGKKLTGGSTGPVIGITPTHGSGQQWEIVDDLTGKVVGTALRTQRYRSPAEWETTSVGPHYRPTGIPGSSTRAELEKHLRGMAEITVTRLLKWAGISE